MLSKDEALDRAQNLVNQATKAGADAADAVYVCDASTEASVRLGNLEEVTRSEGEEIGLRVFLGQRSATISSSSMNPVVLADLVSRALDMAREAPEDQYAGLAPEEMLMTGKLPETDSDDGGDPDPAALKERALACEDAARAIPGITNSEGAGASAGRTVFGLATSHGFAGAKSASGYGLSTAVLAGEGDHKERDYDYRSARHEEDLDMPQAIGSRAGNRAAKRLNPGNVKSGSMPVVLDPRVGSSMIGHLVGAIAGASIARRTSFLLDDLGKSLFDSSLSVIDDPLRERGLGSRVFDGEGLPTAKSAIIDKGVLTGWLMESASARQLGLAPTGHASRGTSGAPGVSASNLHLEGGSGSVAELIADIGEGVYVHELAGQGVNMVTGDYSRGAAGFRIENGEITGPISEFTVAGNLKDMFAAMRAAGDLEFIYSANVPTLRIDGMTVAGG
ncbi:MAG: TldD/PmbA family protein [Sphingorhabdus sp.]